MTDTFTSAWCDRCGSLQPASDIVDGVCAECDAEIERTPLEPTDAEIDRALARMDYLFGRDWFEAKR